MGNRPIQDLEFIHLRMHSAYSLAEGAIKIDDVSALCHQHKMPAVAITDSHNMFGAMEFASHCAKNGIQPIIGCQLNLNHDGKITEIVTIAQTEQGYFNLIALMSESYIQDPHHPSVTLERLLVQHQGIILLTGGAKGYLGQTILQADLDKAHQFAQILHQRFQDRLYIEVQRHGLKDEEATEDGLINLAYDLNIPIVATNDVFFPTPDLYQAHDALLCIAEGKYVTQDERRKVTPSHYFKSQKEMVDLFKDLPEAIQNTINIAKRCYFLLEGRNPILPPFPGLEDRTEDEELGIKAQEGLSQRLEKEVYPLFPDTEKIVQGKIYQDRLTYEIDIIQKMGFSGYFLIVSDFIQWAKRQRIPVGPGRGSGAGSLVAWSLSITNIDPIRFGLIFERFLNPERVSMPDFDVDFCQERRDEVISYVAERYGAEKVAHIITFGKMQARAVLRDVGRVLQMPYSQVDRISKLVPNNPANPVTIQEALKMEPLLEQERQNDPSVANLIAFASQLEGLYRHASTHAAGVVIGDRPLQNLIPLYQDPSSQVPATQFSMKYVEMAGLVKFDFLGLKTLTVIEHCSEIIRQTIPDFSIHDIPLDDKKTFKLLCDVDTVGIFQLESGGMKDVVRKLRADRFEDIIVLVALYRPGPMDDIPKYLARKHGEEDITYLHPLLETILKPSYGVMVYQEQVMHIAQVLGGYSLGAADLLRRAMGKKIKKEMDAQRELFVSGTKDKGVDHETANLIFDQMAKFAGYGFNKSHSAPYALLTYQTAYLKAHFPQAFYAASMTLDLTNTDKLMIFRQDMEKAGISLFPPDVNHSFSEFVVENEGVRYGLAAIKNVGEGLTNHIVEERQKNGPYKDVHDFFDRLDPKICNKRQMENLVASGALDSFHPNRREVFDNLEFFVRQAQQYQAQRKDSQTSLFSFANQQHLKLNIVPTDDWGYMERLQKEFDALGFYQSSHPLMAFIDYLKNQHVVFMNQFFSTPDGSWIKISGVVLSKKERVSKSGNKYAFVQLSDHTGSFEVTVFSEALSAHRDLLNPGKLVLMNALIKHEGDMLRITVQGIEQLDPSDQPLILHVHEKSNIQKIITTLKKQPMGATPVSISVDLNDLPSVAVCLHTKFDISQDLRATLIQMCA